MGAIDHRHRSNDLPGEVGEWHHGHLFVLWIVVAGRVPRVVDTNIALPVVDRMQSRRCMLLTLWKRWAVSSAILSNAP